MDLDVNEYIGRGWASKWKEKTGLSLFTRMPFSNWHKLGTLSEYLHGLELEQFCADSNALGMFRFKSPSNSGVVYWSMNKGGPLFQFGCVDYGGFPLMSYYAVKKIFAPIAVKAYRDLNDIEVILSSHATEETTVTVESFHMDRDGKVLGSWNKEISLHHGELLRAIRMSDLYGKIIDRTSEFIYTRVRKDDDFIAEDLLMFCQHFEFNSADSPIQASVQASGQNKWKLHLTCTLPTMMVQLDGNHKLLFSDNYFPLMPNLPDGIIERLIEVTLLERLSEEPLKLTVGQLGCDKQQTIQE